MATRVHPQAPLALGRDPLGGAPCPASAPAGQRGRAQPQCAPVRLPKGCAACGAAPCGGGISAACDCSTGVSPGQRSAKLAQQQRWACWRQREVLSKGPVLQLKGQDELVIQIYRG